MTTDLPARLEAGPGSRELSDEVLEKAFGWQVDNQQGVGWVWVAPNCKRQPYNDCDPTLSVDDGLALLAGMEGKWDWGLGHGLDVANGKVVTYAVIGRRGDQCPHESNGAATPALALCAALVRAKQQEDSSDG